jgi:uncharacterized damage-inducible protein DinB
MREYFRLLAGYNARVNRTMFDILSALPDESRRKEIGSYFHSIYGVLSHVYDSDLVWLKRFRAAYPDYRSLESPELSREVISLTTEMFPDFQELRARREAMDELFVAFCGEIQTDGLDRTLAYTNTRGEQKGYLVWQVLIHIFNHQTHHRGQIAGFLDQMGVKNDYSNIVTYVDAIGRS